MKNRAYCIMAVFMLVVSPCISGDETAALDVEINESYHFELQAQNIVGKRFIPKRDSGKNLFAFSELPLGDYIIYVVPNSDEEPECIIWKHVSLLKPEKKKIRLDIPLNRLLIKCLFTDYKPDEKNGTALAKVELMVDQDDKVSPALGISEEEKASLIQTFKQRKLSSLISGYGEDKYKIAPYYQQWILFRKNKKGEWEAMCYWMAPGCYKVTFMKYPAPKTKQEEEEYDGDMGFSGMTYFLLPVTEKMIKEGSVTYEH